MKKIKKIMEYFLIWLITILVIPTLLRFAYEFLGREPIPPFAVGCLLFVCCIVAGILTLLKHQDEL